MKASASYKLHSLTRKSRLALTALNKTHRIQHVIKYIFIDFYLNVDVTKDFLSLQRVSFYNERKDFLILKKFPSHPELSLVSACIVRRRTAMTAIVR